MKLKKIVAGVLATTMVISGSVTAFATEMSGGTTGTGELEGTVSTDVFSVVLPTINTGDSTFDFILDPEGLITATTAARYSGDTFGSGTLFFSNSSGTTDYSNTSDALKVINKSSVDVDVVLSATVSNAEGISLTSDSTFADDTSASIYLAIKSGTDETPITESGATVKTQIAAAPSGAYEVQWNSTDSKYEYVLADEANTTFADYSFQLTGAANVNGDWSGLADAAPEVAITWNVTVHSDAPVADVTVSSDAASVTWDRTSELTIAVDSAVVSDMSAGDFGINYDGTIYCYSGVYNGNTGLATSSFASLEGNTITLDPSVAKFLPEGGTLYIIDEEGAIAARVTVD